MDNYIKVKYNQDIYACAVKVGCGNTMETKN